VDNPPSTKTRLLPNASDTSVTGHFWPSDFENLR